jgi:DNA-binding LacI/PurR family transcriptional regulator
VCANDSLALLAHAFIVDRGGVPGRDIMLCGFDNSPFAAQLGLTTYDFCHDTMAAEAARHIVQGGPSKGGVVSLKGRLHCRQP